METDQNSKKTDNLWNKVLSEAVSKENNQDANLIILGKEKAGKRELISSIERRSGERMTIDSRNDNSILNLMKDEDIASIVDFKYISIKNPDDDNIEMAKIKIWMFHEECPDELLNELLDEKLLKNLIVMVVLDFEEYYTIIDQLENGLNFCVQKLMPKLYEVLQMEQVDESKKHLDDVAKNYMDPTTDETGKVINRKSDLNPEEDEENLILPKGMETNCGFPIFIVANKSDKLVDIQQESPNSDEILEMLSYTLRKNAITYGAPIFYTSSKMNLNIDVLYDYLKFYLYKFPFPHSAKITKDSLFVPIGYDNVELINSSFEKYKDKIFEDVIEAPKKKAEREITQDLVVISHEEFLKKLQDTSSKPQLEDSTLNASSSNINNSIGAKSKNAAKKQRPQFSRDQRKKLLNILNRDGSSK